MGASLSSDSLLELEANQAIVAQERVPIEADNPDIETMSCSEIGMGAAGGIGMAGSAIGAMAIFLEVMEQLES